MKYENLLKIHIPQPCHEDWDKMTPNEQGAYCNECCKTVIDFSDKPDEFIEKYLNDNIAKKVCGRFRIDQLEETPKLKIEAPKFEFPSFLLPVITPFRVAALSLMLFASAAFTSCGNSDGGLTGEPKYERLAGAVEMRIDSSNVKDTTCKINQNDDNIVGKIKVNNFNPPEDTLKADTTNVLLKGEVQTRKKQGMVHKTN
jgi:hypothetical protein